MSNQKGVTLISLIIYIIILIIIISILSLVSQMFFTNMKYITERGKYISEFNKFNMYFIKDVKNNKDIIEKKEDSSQIIKESSQIIFEDGTIYTYNSEENSIYRNKVKICNNISNCTFSAIDTNPSETGGITKKIIKVNMLIKGTKNLKTTNEYVLKYW